MRDWFAAFDRKRDKDISETGATRATTDENAKEMHGFRASTDVAQIEIEGATGATANSRLGGFVAHVAQVKSPQATGDDALKPPDNVVFPKPVAHDAHVAQKIDMTAPDIATGNQDGTGADARRIVEWLNGNRVPSDPGRCARCGEDDVDSRAVVLPFGTSRNGQTWLHGRCWADWYERRRNQAVDALALANGVALKSGHERNR